MAKQYDNQKIPVTRIYFNAGHISERVLDLVDKQNNDNFNLYIQDTPDCVNYNFDSDYEKFSPFFVEIKDETQENIDTFVNKLNRIYPLEVKSNYTPPASAKAGSDKGKIITKKKTAADKK